MIVLIAAAAASAVGDWLAVARHNKRVEYVCKPATTIALIAIALALHPHIASVRVAFVVALVFSLAGDVFLMLPFDAFILGLASFFVAHVAYVVGFVLAHPQRYALIGGVAFVGVYAPVVGLRVVRATPRDLRVPVVAYIGVISAMVAFAIGSGNVLAGSGAGAFMASDTMIAWNRFVRPLTWAPVAIMVSYHVAQALLVASLRF